MSYYSAIQLVEEITKAVTHSPNYLLNQFHKDSKDIQIDDTKVDLLVSFNWLDEKLKEMYNSIASIINFQ